MRLAVGLVGLGRMGAPMARTLLAGGVPLTVWNRSPGPACELAASGACVAPSPAAVAADADVIVSMLADDAAAEKVHSELLETARPGTVILEMSTLGVPCVERLAERAARSGVAVVDAPVSGSVPAAASGQLVALAEHAGIDPADAYDALADSAVSSPFVAYKRAAFLEPESTPVAFTTRLKLKDVELALALAREHGVTTSLTAEAGSGLTRAVSAGHGDADIANVAAALRAVPTEAP
jgi:3-hydroxyisobutyrate dehydrogenase-like beta-hydroxyacid dehydrogenase